MNRNLFLFITLLQMFFVKLNFAGDLDVNGMVSGSLIETENAIIINGATFVPTDNNVPAISIRKNLPKRVIISKVRVLSNNQKVRGNSDAGAGVVVIDNSNSRSRVNVRDVKVTSRNANISNTSMAKDVCAGVVCSSLGKNDSYKSLSVHTFGNTKISATQGERPDYRKIQH